MIWIGIMALCSFSGMKYCFHDLWLIYLCIHPLNNPGSVPDFVDWCERWENSNIKSKQKEKEDNNNIYCNSLDRECTGAFKKMVNKMSASIFIHLPCYLNSNILYHLFLHGIGSRGTWRSHDLWHIHSSVLLRKRITRRFRFQSDVNLYRLTIFVENLWSELLQPCAY